MSHNSPTHPTPTAEEGVPAVTDAAAPQPQPEPAAAAPAAPAQDDAPLNAEEQPSTQSPPEGGKPEEPAVKTFDPPLWSLPRAADGAAVAAEPVSSPPGAGGDVHICAEVRHISEDGSSTSCTGTLTDGALSFVPLGEGAVGGGPPPLVLEVAAIEEVRLAKESEERGCKKAGNTMILKMIDETIHRLESKHYRHWLRRLCSLRQAKLFRRNNIGPSAQVLIDLRNSPQLAEMKEWLLGCMTEDSVQIVKGPFQSGITPAKALELVKAKLELEASLDQIGTIKAARAKEDALPATKTSDASTKGDVIDDLGEICAHLGIETGWEKKSELGEGGLRFCSSPLPFCVLPPLVR